MDKKYFSVTIFLASLLLVGAVYTFAQKKTDASAKKTLAEKQTSQNSSPSGTLTTVNELKVEDEKVGSGATAISGKSVTVNYLGTLTDGTKFDSSYDRNQPFTFNLGAGEVIKGWDQGVAGMKVGGKRKLTIPASLGYGETGAGNGLIPANATLVFEVELLEVK